MQLEDENQPPVFRNSQLQTVTNADGEGVAYQRTPGHIKVGSSLLLNDQ